MKPISIILFFYIVFTHIGLSQTFSPMMPIPPFEGVANSSIAFADVDGDNDQDVLITGQNNFLTPVAKLYINDGNGIFTEKTGTPFEEVSSGYIAFEDVDGDLDQDVLITGGSTMRFAKLYINDGNGTFTEKTGTPFEGVDRSSIAFADVDGDNDQDVLITGINNSLIEIAKLYTNDGNGIFNEVMGTPFDEVNSGSIAFADVDGDLDQDVLITGIYIFGTPIPTAKLYTNDGNGTFIEAIGTPFDGVAFSSIAFADVDRDLDQDVLITGSNNSETEIAKLYTNDGNGIFTEVTGTAFEGVGVSSIAFADVDGDNDQDVLITGLSNSVTEIAKLYINDGNGIFTEVQGTPFAGIFAGSIAFADIDGDNDQDVLITGWNNYNSTVFSAVLYENTTMIVSNFSIDPFVEQTGIFYPNPSQSGLVYLDYYARQNTDLTVTIFDLTGKEVLKQKNSITEGINTLGFDFSELGQSIHIVTFIDGISYVTRKISLH